MRFVCGSLLIYCILFSFLFYSLMFIYVSYLNVHSRWNEWCVRWPVVHQDFQSLWCRRIPVGGPGGAVWWGQRQRVYLSCSWLTFFDSRKTLKSSHDEDQFFFGNGALLTWPQISLRIGRECFWPGTGPGAWDSKEASQRIFSVRKASSGATKPAGPNWMELVAFPRYISIQTISCVYCVQSLCPIIHDFLKLQNLVGRVCAANSIGYPCVSLNDSKSNAIKVLVKVFRNSRNMVCMIWFKYV